VPAIYHASYAAVDPGNTGETSVNALSRVLNTSLLPAGTIDKVSFLNDSEGLSLKHMSLSRLSALSVLVLECQS
jgi:hypothetical protein